MKKTGNRRTKFFCYAIVRIVVTMMVVPRSWLGCRLTDSLGLALGEVHAVECLRWAAVLLRTPESGLVSFLRRIVNGWEVPCLLGAVGPAGPLCGA